MDPDRTDDWPLEERLASEFPPVVLDAVDVDLLAATTARYIDDAPSGPILEFTWHGFDGRELVYRRWVDEDGERYYLPGEFSRRSGIEV